MKTKSIRLFQLVALFAVLSLWLSACGGKEGTFTLNGHIDGFGTGNLRVVYFDKGAVQNVTATAVDGNFTIGAYASGPVMIRLYTGNGRLLGAFNVSPGDKLEGSFSLTDAAAMRIKGNSDAEKVSEFLEANAEALRSGNYDELNRSIAEYIAANPSRHASGTLLATYFHIPGNEAEAMRLAALLDGKVAATASIGGIVDIVQRLALPADSLRIGAFDAADSKGKKLSYVPGEYPYALLMFTDAEARDSDSIRRLIVKAASPDSLKPFIADISVDTDTVAWHESLKKSAGADSLKAAHRVWTPSPYAMRGLESLAMSRTPWFVVADSAGRVLYSGISASAASTAVSEHRTK